MERLNEAALAEWCGARGLRVALSERPRYRAGSPSVFYVERPSEPARRLALATALVASDLAGQEWRHFGGGVVGITERDIWSVFFDGIGERLLSSLVGAYDPADPMPTYLLPDNDVVGAVALLAIPLLFEWDAFFAPNSARLLVAIWHDRPAEVWGNERDMLETAFRYLEREWSVSWGQGA